VPQVCSKRKQGETGSTIGSTNQFGMHGTINSMGDDEKNFFYRPLTHLPVGISNYMYLNTPLKPIEAMPVHKRYWNSLSTIAKDETSHDENFMLHNMDISNAISPMKTDEECSRISYMQYMHQKVIELEQAAEMKNLTIEQQK
jgi:hypothetical protein